MQHLNDMSVREDVLIDVFEMLVKRLDSMNEVITKLNSFMLTETRRKVNNDTIPPGSIFNYPFEIQNFRFDKRMYGYVSLKLNMDSDTITLLDLWWNLWDADYSQKPRTVVQFNALDKLRSFVIGHLSPDTYKKIEAGMERYKECEDDACLTCTYYGIESVYDQLSTHMLNEFITKNEGVKEFVAFDHSDICLNIHFVNEGKSLYIDEMLQTILVRLSPYGYKPNDFVYVKVVGLDFDMSQFISHTRFDVTIEDCNEEYRQRRIKKANVYIQSLCNCAKRRLRRTLMDLVSPENDTLHLLHSFDDVFSSLGALE